MGNTIKGLRCNCGHQQNVPVPEALLGEALLGAFCPNCGAWVTLGEALGLTFGQALVAVLAVAVLLA